MTEPNRIDPVAPPSSPPAAPAVHTVPPLLGALLAAAMPALIGAAAVAPAPWNLVLGLAGAAAGGLADYWGLKVGTPK